MTAVHGGSGGIGARLDDLELAAQRLSDLAGELADVTGAAFIRQLDPREASYALIAPAAYLRVEQTQGLFVLASATVAADLALTATSLRLAAAAYRDAEEYAPRLIDGMLTGLGNLAGHAVRLILPGVIVTGVVVFVGAAYIDGLALTIKNITGIDVQPHAVDRLKGLARGLAQTGADTLKREAFEHPDGVQLLLEHFLPGFVTGFFGVPPGTQVVFEDGPWPDDSQELTNLVYEAGLLFGIFRHKDVTVTVHRDEETQKRVGRVAPENLGQLYREELTAHQGRDNGRVRVDVIEGPDGKKRAIVYIPATTDWAMETGENTTDTTTNVETSAGNDSAMREVVRQALADQDLPPGTEIMLVGYSQGGIVAMSLANDPEFTAQHNVTTVVTVGSPVADFDAIPADIEVLSIEHSNDLVPHLDGNDNPDQSNWTTVDTDGLLDSGDDPAHAHSGETYTDTIDRLESEQNEAIEEFKRRRSEFFDGTVTDSTEYEGRRE